MKKIIALVMGVSIMLGAGGSAQAKSRYSVNRISELNRYETSINIANNFTSDKLKSVIIANEKNFPDALSGSALAAKENCPVILTDGDSISEQNKPVISNADIKKLMISGDESFQKMLKTNVDGDSYIDLSGISYAKVKDYTGFYKSVQEYLNKKYGFSNYYTDRFINSTADFAFTYVNGELYMRYGNPEPAIIVKNAQIVSKKYDGNKVCVKIKGYYGGDESTIDAALIYNGNRWLVDEFNNWGVE